MSDYTIAEVRKAFRGLELTELGNSADGTEDVILLRGEVVKVAKAGAVMGDNDSDGEEIWIVIKVGDQFFKKTGWYYSHSGAKWNDGVTEVKPVQKFVTVYEGV